AARLRARRRAVRTRSVDGHVEGDDGPRGLLCRGRGAHAAQRHLGGRGRSGGGGGGTPVAGVPDRVDPVTIRRCRAAVGFRGALTACGEPRSRVPAAGGRVRAGLRPSRRPARPGTAAPFTGEERRFRPRSEPAGPVAEPGVVAEGAGGAAVGVAASHRVVHPADRGVARPVLLVEATVRLVVAGIPALAPQLVLSQPPVVPHALRPARAPRGHAAGPALIPLAVAAHPRAVAATLAA